MSLFIPFPSAEVGNLKKKKKNSQNPLQLWYWKLIRLYQWPPLAQDMQRGSEMVISSHGFWLTLLGQVMAFLQWCLCLFILWLPRAQRLLPGCALLPETPSTAQLSAGTDICFSCCCCFKPWDTHSSPLPVPGASPCLTGALSLPSAGSQVPSLSSLWVLSRWAVYFLNRS